MALGVNHEISEGKLNLLLEDKNILEAAKAVKVSGEKNDVAAGMAAWHKLWMLLGKARLDFAFLLIYEDDGPSLMVNDNDDDDDNAYYEY